MQIAPPRWHFVPADLDASNLKSLLSLFEVLQDRPIQTVEDLVQWLLDESELNARISAEVARRYIRMTCHTDDASHHWSRWRAFASRKKACTRSGLKPSIDGMVSSRSHDWTSGSMPSASAMGRAVSIVRLRGLA